MLTVKKYFFIFMFCFLTSLLSFHHLWAEEALKKTPSDQQKDENQQEQVSTKKQPQMSLDYTQYDVGDIYEGEEASHTFTVKNTGTAQLNIANVRAG